MYNISSIKESRWLQLSLKCYSAQGHQKL